jgi:hypothetical protein
VEIRRLGLRGAGGVADTAGAVRGEHTMPSDALLRAVERTIDALHAIANDLSRQPAWAADDAAAYQRRIAERLRWIADELEAAQPPDVPPAP